MCWRNEMRYVFIFKRSERRFRVGNAVYCFLWSHEWIKLINLQKKFYLCPCPVCLFENMQENLSSVFPTRSDKNQAAYPLKFNSLTSCVNLLISDYLLLIANFITWWPKERTVFIHENSDRSDRLTLMGVSRSHVIEMVKWEFRMFILRSMTKNTH